MLWKRRGGESCGARLGGSSVAGARSDAPRAARLGDACSPARDLKAHQRAPALRYFNASVSYQTTALLGVVYMCGLRTGAWESLAAVTMMSR